MIKRYILAALCVFAVANVQGQVRLELSFDQETYLPNEPLYANVRIYNSSGQTIVFGKDNFWLSFSVESSDGRVVKQLKPVDVEGEFALPSAHRARKTANLAEAFDLTRFGRYTVTARVQIREWNDEAFKSDKKEFGISNGVTLWEGQFGIPGDAGGRPEIRKYQLVQANHLKALALYVRVTDEIENEVFSLFPLGPLLGVSRPEAQTDRWSNLHVFYQDGARSFRYCMITPDGLLLARQTWDIDETRPALKLDKDGRIKVAGGLRRASSSDLPPPELLTEIASPEPEQTRTAATNKADGVPAKK